VPRLPIFLTEPHTTVEPTPRCEFGAVPLCDSIKMKFFIILSFCISACCLAAILVRKRVRWHSDILFTDKGKENLDSIDKGLALIGFFFLLTFLVKLLLSY
jgi:hypothetical protein